LLQDVKTIFKNKNSVSDIDKFLSLADTGTFHVAESHSVILDTTAATMLGYEKKDELPTFETLLKQVPSEMRKELSEKYTILFENKIIKKVQFAFNRVNTDKGEQIWLECNAALEKPKDNSGIFAYGTLRDVTLEKKKEAELMAEKQKALDADRLKTAFLHNLSHELRTPMNAILGFSELINIGRLAEEKKNEFSRIIQTKGNTLINLIDDIIEISKFETGQISVTRTEFNLNNLLKEIKELASDRRITMHKEQVEIYVIQPEIQGNEMIYADSGRIIQVMDKLVHNAFKYTDKGKVEIGVHRKDKKWIQFYVSDTGCGISSEQERNIFNRFRKHDEKTSMLLGTSGLGLTISKGIIEMLGGKLWLESKPGDGSTFYFTIPYHEKPEKGIESEIASPAERDNNNWKNRIFLVAEDEDVNYKFLEVILHQMEAQVIRAKNGKEAVELVKKINNIDLVLMDIKMPVMNGFDATKEIRKIKPEIKIIAQTAYSMKDEQEKCMKSGCDDYLAKPLDINMLTKKINALL